MDHLSKGYSSSSASNSSHENNSESDDPDDFHVISVSCADSSQSQTQKSDATTCFESQNGRKTKSDDERVSRNQLKKIERWIAFVGSSTPERQTFTEIVRRNKNFRNPAIFEKMISYCGIDEFGTNIKGRKPLQEGDFYTDIREIQDMCMDANKCA